MTGNRDYGPISDEDLVAYLDGMLDDESTEHVAREVAKDRDLDRRLAVLKKGDRPFVDAFDLLLQEAPTKKLEQGLDLILNPPPPPVEEPVPLKSPEVIAAAPARKEPWGGWRVLAAAAVLLAVFSAGLFTSRVVPGLGPQVVSISGEKGWRAAVAEYQSLFVKATLEQSGKDWGAQEASLKSALSHLGLDLSVSKVTVDPLAFKYAGILNFKGKPLVQMAYLYDGKVPVSFCIIKNGKPDHDLKSEQRKGLNIAHWQSSSYGFMVIGDVPSAAVDKIARQLMAKLS